MVGEVSPSRDRFYSSPPPAGWADQRWRGLSSPLPEAGLRDHFLTISNHTHTGGPKGVSPDTAVSISPLFPGPSFPRKAPGSPRSCGQSCSDSVPCPFPPLGPSPNRQPALDPPSVKPYRAQTPVGTARDSLQASVRLSHSPRVCVTCCCLPAPPPRCAVGSWGQWKPLHKLIPTFSAALSPIHTFWGCLLAPALHETEPQAIASQARADLPLSFHSTSGRSCPRAAPAGHWPAILAAPAYLVVPGHALSSHISGPSQELVATSVLGGPPTLQGPLTSHPLPFQGERGTLLSKFFDTVYTVPRSHPEKY